MKTNEIILKPNPALNRLVGAPAVYGLIRRGKV